jgi:hypothetical protein
MSSLGLVGIRIDRVVDGYHEVAIGSERETHRSVPVTRIRETILPVP